jgi:hypothetical protein
VLLNRVGEDVISWYFPHRLVRYAGRKVDRLQVFPSSSDRVLERISKGKEEGLDWLHFYTIQSRLLFIFAVGSLAFSAVVLFVGMATKSFNPNWRKEFYAVACLTCAAVAFNIVIDFHRMATDATGRKRRLPLAFLRYFERPNRANLLVIPLSWSICYTILVAVSGL